jgi:hypothetical protein
MSTVLRCASGIVLFLGVFVLSGLFVSPYVPPYPKEPVSVLEIEYWTTNWVGLVLGVVCVVLSARMERRRGRWHDGDATRRGRAGLGWLLQRLLLKPDQLHPPANWFTKHAKSFAVNSGLPEDPSQFAYDCPDA